jgi:ankyrin repeat protein/beta-lactamase regulating signal transducer with metallopeptidase domain
MEDYLTQITNYLLTQSWQIAILVAAVAAVSWLLRNKSAHVRYLLWLIVLAKCLVPPLVTVPLAVLPEERPVIVFEPAQPTVTEPVVPSSAEVALPSGPAIVKHTPRLTSHQWLGIGWIAGLSVFVLVALIKAWRTVWWLRRERRPLPAELHSTIQRLFSDFRTLPRLWLIQGIGQPFVWGLLRGSIYLPADFVKVDNAEHRKGVLGHELSHILRFDAAVNCLQVMAQAIFWFHPFVWWANKRIRAEREKCCDEMAIARLGAKAKDYSSAIVNILISEQESTRPVPSLAVAGPVKNIEERIKTMLRPGKKFYKHPSLIAAITFLFIALLTVPTGLVLTSHAGGKEDETVVAYDDFDAKLNLNWNILHVDPTHWSLSKKPGTLTITTQDGTFHRGRTDYKNLFLIDCPTAWGEDFQVTTCILSFNPVAEWNEAGLICWNDEDNNLKLDYEWHTLGGNPETPPQRIFTVAAETQDSGGVLFRTTSFRADQQLEKVWLRVTKRGNKYTFQTSTDGKSFVPLESESVILRYGTPFLFPEGEPNLTWGDGTVRRVGFFANNGSRDGAPEIDASFDFFEVKALHPSLPEPIEPTKSLFRAAAEGDVAQVKLHISKGSDINEKTTTGDTALHYAARHDHKDVVDLLTANRADINAKNKNGDTPAHIALWEGSKEALDLLIAKGAKISCIQFSAYQGDLPTVKSFVGQGVSVNMKDIKGFIPLHHAVVGGHRDVVEFLIAKGADVDAKDRYGWTPLDIAAWEGHADLAEILIKAGAQVNSRYAWGETPLIWAAQKGHASVIELLLAKGADINARCLNGLTALHYAARAGHGNVVELLISKGADISASDFYEGLIPLHHAARGGHVDVAKALISKGVDVNAKDNYGRSPLDLAKQQRQKEMVELLRKYGAKE